MSEDVQRSVLPIPGQPYGGFVAYDAKSPEARFAPIEPLRPPAGAPNVLVILLDDVGFGASSAFGGPISTPAATCPTPYTDTQKVSPQRINPDMRARSS